MPEYPFNVATDTLNGSVNLPLLHQEIVLSGLPDFIGVTAIPSGVLLKVEFSSSLSGGDLATLTTLVGQHDGTADPPVNSAPLTRNVGITMASMNPTTDENASKGFKDGLLWFNSTNNCIFLLANAATGMWICYSPGPTVSATDPAGAVPGATYYNSVLGEEMVYDDARSKWLSKATFFEGGGRNGSTSPNVFYRRFNGMPAAESLGGRVPKGTLIRATWTQANSVTTSTDILVGGSVVATISTGGVASGEVSLNVDFDAGVLAFRNSSSGATTTNMQLTAHYKMRV